MRVVVLGAWAGLAVAVIAGALAPAGSPVLAAAGKMPDKWMHFLAYMGLAGLPVVGLRRQGVMAGLAMFGLGCALEFAQQFSPGRHVEILDLLANGVGVGSGVLLARPLRDWVG